MANRVGKIQSCTNPEQWRHVKSNENPADLLSRGCGVSFLGSNRLWWQGPKFIWLNNAEWPSTAISKPKFDTERKRQISHITNHHKIISTKVNNEMALGRLAPEHFSDWLEYVRLFALVVRFVENCKLSCADRRYGELSSEEIGDVETRVLMLTQKDAFTIEYKALSQGKEIARNSVLLKLRPKLWTDGLIRCNGRLNFAEHLPFSARCPIILQRKSWVTMLIVKHYHEKMGHH